MKEQETLSVVKEKSEMVESQTEHQFKLKLLNGPLVDRELNLKLGEFSIGGHDSDLAISLENGVNVKLLVNHDGIQLAHLVPCWVDGKRWVTQTAFPLNKAIDLAGLGVVFSEPDNEFPHLRLPPRQSTGVHLSVIGVMILIFVVGMAGILASLWPAPSVKNKVPVFDPKEWVSTQLRVPALRNLKVNWDQTHVLTLSGSCQTSKDMAVFRAALNQHGILFRDQSVCQDDLLRSANALLALNGYDTANVTAGSSPGTLVISGAIHADDRWNETARQLDALPGLIGWTIKNNTDTLIPELVEALRKQKLLMGISLTWQGRNLLASGNFNPQQEAAIRSVIIPIATRYGISTSFQNIIPSINPASLLPAPVMSLGGDPQSLFLTLSNGVRLEVGSVLPSGYEITAIDESGIELLKNDQLLYLPIN